MPYIHDFEAKEKMKKKRRTLALLLCFVSRETALSVATGTELTMWQVLNRLADEGFTVLGESTTFVIDTGCGKLELDASTWNLEFEDDSFESYFINRSSHLETLMAKVHHFDSMGSEVESETA